MFGLHFSALVLMFVSVAVTVYVLVAKNPHAPGSAEARSLRACRTGLGFLVWSWHFGPVGYAFALAAFSLGVLGILRGRTAYGVGLVAGALLVSLLLVFLTVHSVAERFKARRAAAEEREKNGGRTIVLPPFLRRLGPAAFFRVAFAPAA